MVAGRSRRSQQSTPDLERSAPLSGRPHSGEPVKAPAPGKCQRAFRTGQEKQGQGGRAVSAVLLRRRLTATASCRWSWSGSKKISAALMPLNFADLSMANILSSGSAANVSYWAYHDPACTSARSRYVRRRCGSWRGSIPSTWKIPAAAAGVWCTIWPMRASR